MNKIGTYVLRKNYHHKIIVIFLEFAYNNIADGTSVLYIRVTELTFKRTVSSPATEPPQGGFFMEEQK
jgi:hypothetical protein